MTNLHKKGGAALVTAALIVLTLGAALVFTACPNNAGGSGSGGGTPPTPKHAVTFGVDGGHGTLKAKADGGTETEMRYRIGCALHGDANDDFLKFNSRVLVEFRLSKSDKTLNFGKIYS